MVFSFRKISKKPEINMNLESNDIQCDNELSDSEQSFGVKSDSKNLLSDNLVNES